MSSSDKVLTKREVASLLRVSENTIDRQRAKNKIKSFKVGQQVRFPSGQFDKMIRDKK